MEDNFRKDQERRQFIRVEYIAPFAYKICKEETILKLLKGYTSNISPAGLLCNIKDCVRKDDIIWLSFDKDTLSACTDMEKRSFIYQNGVIGKVVRVEESGSGTYNVGVQFVTREEKASSYIHSKINFIQNE